MACHLATSSICTRCTVGEEFILHALRDCIHAKVVWTRIGIDTPMLMSFTHIVPWMQHILQHKDKLLIISTLWCLWRWRNNTVLAHETWPLQYVLHLVHQTSMELRLYCEKNPPLSTLTWSPPTVDVVKVNVDGSCIPPHSMGGGGFIRDTHGEWL
uniref:Ribonuclease H protein At1g65750 family n=1 Tax=Cajanus cajan TaxID=3821 RepID=A0A151R0A4_CAJCA|nr:Putative ribonuclease H protein At1g65750 family [Cajanus cajan]